MTTASMFLNSPRVEFSDDSKSAVLLSALVYLDESIGEIVVPEEFFTDFASVPWFFSRVVPRVYGTAAPAILHDFLYSTNGLNGKLTRKQCDQIFADALRSIGFEEPRVLAAYAGVRVGGWRAWNRYKQELAA